VVVVVVAVVAIIAVTVVVPAMIMRYNAVGAFPVAIEESFSIVARSHPDGAFIRGTRPVAIVPPVMAAYGIPVAVDPGKAWARRCGANDNPGPRRGADSNT